ncbi:MerR family transcriptional regulator [Fictibacillus norfolkensis]|uniref:MerR family transcriptional regulator n=1 Tax=Fictibacillus norfolkensis TaxID=2762233 RepID=A0ABR8SK59_9BACL|nr:MerR family transcriptional regulator [Fictibacillus norfolkensis]MBD7963867.1 MerR family transcriptional regulator [Fictibacillus norfolkensis]
MLHIHKVSELTGVTVRTLRHYDQIGLLQSTSKTEGGHSLYSNGDLKKLQQIQFMKKIGFRLNEIKNMLNSSDWDWSDSLRNQLSYVKQEQENLNKMESALRELIHGMAIEDENNEIAIQKVMQLANSNKVLQQKYRRTLFKERELKLWKKVPNMTSDHPDTLEWIALIGQLKRFINEDPGCSNVQNIIRRMDEKRAETFGGETEFLDKLWDVRMSEKKSEQLGLYPIDQDVLEYMNAAYKIFIGKKG